MRRLGDALGVVPMAIYNHVASKDKLLDGMIDTVFSEIDLPDPSSDWKLALRQVAISARAALSRHQWAIGLLESRTSPGAENLRQHDAVLGCLREAGFSLQAATRAYSVLNSYTYGYALQEKYRPFTTPEELEQLIEGLPRSFEEEYPYLAELVVEISSSVAERRKSGFDTSARFESALDLILGSVERLRHRPRGRQAKRKR